MTGRYVSPQFPRLLNGDVIKDTIVRGVENGLLAYVGKKSDGSYFPFHWQASLGAQDIEISDDMYVIQQEVAEAYKAGKSVPSFPTPTSPTSEAPNTEPLPISGSTTAASSLTGSTVWKLTWSGEIPAQKWMNFYTKVLSKFAAGMGLKLTLKVEVTSESGIPAQKIEETKIALRELGLNDQTVCDEAGKET